MNTILRIALTVLSSGLFSGMLGAAIVPKCVTVSEGLTYVTVQFSYNDRPSIMHFIILDQGKYSLRILDNGPDRAHPRYENLESALRKERCLAGTNAGFFSIPEFTPDGLMIAHGKRTGKFIPKAWTEGVLFVRQGVITLKHKTEFVDDSSISDLIQSGPWLVRNGVKAPGLDSNDSVTARTFVAIDNKNRIAIGYCNHAKLSEMAELLTSKDIREYFEFEGALNLDGGPSSGFALLDSSNSILIPERWTVRSFIAVIPTSTK